MFLEKSSAKALAELEARLALAEQAWIEMGVAIEARCGDILKAVRQDQLERQADNTTTVAALEKGNALFEATNESLRRLDDALRRPQVSGDPLGNVREGLNQRIDSVADRVDLLFQVVRTGSERVTGSFSRLNDSLAGGPSSAVEFGAPAPFERIFGALEVARQETQAPALFGASPTSSPFDRGGEWKRLDGPGTGSWGAAYRVRSLASWRGRLFASVQASDDPNDSGIWSFGGSRWKQVLSVRQDPGLDGCEFNGLHAGDDAVYAAISGPRGGLWRLTETGAEHLPLPNQHELIQVGAYCVTGYEGGVVMGCDPAEVHHWANGTWRKLAGDGELGGWQAHDLDGMVYTLATIGDELYAGLAVRGYGPAPATIWRLKSRQWSVVAGEGVRGSWLHPHIAYVLSVGEHDGAPVAAVTRPKTMAQGASSLFTLQSEVWRPIGRAAMPHAVHRCHVYNHTLSWQGRLYVAVGDLSRSRGAADQYAAIWELDFGDGRWRAVAGDGEFPAWAATDLVAPEKTDPTTAGLWPYQLSVHEGALACALAGHRYAGQVWIFEPTP